MTRVKPLVVSEDSLYNSSQFKDPVFAEGLRDWMARQMPMMPMGLLSDDAEHWEVERPARFIVEDEQEFTFYVCTGCEDRINFMPDTDALRCSTCFEEGEEPPQMRTETVEGFAVRDTETGCLLSPNDTRTREDEEVPTPDGIVSLFILQRDAEREVEAQQEQQDDEHDDGPWMHNWFFHPDRYVDTSTLQEAGFTVALYSGGSGSAVRLAGVNGVGYNHELEHYAKLYVRHHFSRGLCLVTQVGRVFVFPRDTTPAALRDALNRAGL